MDLVNILNISANAIILIIIGSIFRMHVSKLNKMEETLKETISEDDIRELIDKRFDEKIVLLDYRLKELTKTIDKLDKQLDKLQTKLDTLSS